jgi:hypothetical protein
VQAQSAPAGAHLSYYGGRVISNVQVVQVLYGAGTYTPEVQSTASPSIATFYRGVTNSTYYDWLNEYNTPLVGGTNQTIGRGSFLKQVQITPSPANSGSIVDDTQIQAELAAQVAAGNLPAPTLDAAGNVNTYYAIYFPANVTITMGGSSSGVQFCAYHGTIAANGPTPELYYGVLPDFTTGGMRFGCGGGTRFQNETSVSSHELVEATTDAEVGIASTYAPPLAWYDTTNGEIGDICNGQQGTVVGGDGVTYTVQLEFSNIANNCIVSRTATNDFGIAASPASVTLTAGTSGSTTINTTNVGTPETVSFAASGLPTRASATFSPASVTSGSSSSMTINTGSASPGSYTVTVTGTGTAGAHATSVALTINPVQPPSDFSVGVTPSSVSVTRGSSGTTTVTTSAVNAPEAVTLSASGLPSGVTASFSPTTVTAGATSTLTLTATSSAPTGTATVTVTGTATSGGPHSANVSLTVTPAASGGVVNGGFETGTFSGWTTSGASSAIVSSGCHSGTYCARLGNTSPTRGNSSAAQTFTAGAGTSSLSLYYKVTCPDTVTKDWATATLKDNTTNATTTILTHTCTNTGAWVKVTAGITAGHRYTLTLTNRDDDRAGNATYTLYDDVALT